VDLILASTSPYRRALLGRLGVPFRTQAPSIDEDALKARLGPIDPADLAVNLADAKAALLAAGEPSRIVVACDQLVSWQGEVLGKPGSARAAADQLRRLAGTAHDLITALTVAHVGQMHRYQDVARLTMRPLTETEIARYIAADRPFDCAGSYKIEQRGIALFERVEAADYSAIMGLPLIALTTILRTLGVPVP
jgi:septum formation protein